MRTYLLAAVLMGAVVGCDSATASEGRQAPQQEVRADGIDVPMTFTPHVAVVSLRRMVSGLYAVRGVSNTPDVHVSVRRAATSLGFSDVTAGTLVLEDTGPSPLEFQFTPTAGYRYLVVATPHVNGVENPNEASFFEIVL